MNRKLPLLAGSFLIASLTSFAVSAGTVPTPAPLPTPHVEKVGWGDSYDYDDYDGYYRHSYYGGGCRFWRHECDRQWSWNRSEYLLCLRRHACGGNDHYYRYYNYYRYRGQYHSYDYHRYRGQYHDYDYYRHRDRRYDYRY